MRKVKKNKNNDNIDNNIENNNNIDNNNNNNNNIDNIEYKYEVLHILSIWSPHLNIWTRKSIEKNTTKCVADHV